MVGAGGTGATEASRYTPESAKLLASLFYDILMQAWILYELLLPGATEGVVITWRDGIKSHKLRTKAWTLFCARWGEMRVLNQGQWPPAWTKQLSGHPGIFEMRLKVMQHQYRPLFFFGPVRGELTFVFMADEVGDAFVPKDAPGRAERARDDVLNHRSEIRELEIE